MAAPVYDDQDLRYRRRSDALTQQDRMRSLNQEEKAAAERQRYDEQSAGIAAADDERSQQSGQILQNQNSAATGRTGSANTIAAGGAGAASAASARDPSETRPAGNPNDPRGDTTGKAGGAGAGASGAAASSSSLYRKESAGGGENSMYRDEGPKNKKLSGKMVGQWAKNKRFIVIFTSLVTSIAGVIAGLFTAILPFQVPSITQFLEDLKYASFNNASSRTFDILFTSYLKNILLPGMRANGCPSTNVNRSCTGDITGDSPVALLFRKWSGAEGRLQSFESQLASRGIEIYSSNGSFRMRSPAMGDDAIDLTDIERNGETNIFNSRELSRAEVRAEFRRIIDQESGYKKLMMRFRVGALLKKHGIIRCLVACDFQDRVYGGYQDKKKAALAYLNRRILEPRSQLLGLYVNCLLNPCSDELNSDGEVNDESTNGEPMDEVRRNSRDALSRYSAAFGADRLRALVQNAENLDRDGMSLHLTKLAIQKLGGSLTGREITPEIATKIAGPVGWVLAATRLVVLAYDANQLKTMNYAMNAAAGVAMFEMYRTAAHETRAHHMDATMLGSITNMMRHGPFNEGPGMEDAPIYDETFASVMVTPTSAFMRTILPQKAYAQTDQARLDAPETYNCNEGTIYENAVATNSISNTVCPESRLGYANLVTVMSDFLQTIPGLGFVVNVVQFVQSVIGGIASFLGEAIIEPILRGIGLGPMIDSFTAWIGNLLTQFMNVILKNPLGDRPSGAKAMEVTVMGAEVGGQEAAHRLAGGGVLTSAQQTAILQEEFTNKREAFATLPLKERLFSPDYAYSMTSQVAFNMPSDVNSAMRRSFAGLLGNPIGKITNSFASIFTMNQSVYAQAVVARPSPFDIVAHGIPQDHPFFQTDPMVYWDQNCADGKVSEAYNTAQEDIEDPALKKFGYLIDPNTNQVVNPEPNPCFMLSTAGKHDEAPAAPGGAGAPTGPGTSTIVGDTAFPLQTTKSGVQNADIFRNGTTDIASHGYTAYDILAAPGTPVVAFQDGVVKQVGSDVCGGRLLGVYNQASNTIASYLHLNTSGHAADGDTVTKGQQIGVVGGPAVSCNIPHLHIDVYSGDSRPACSRSNCPADRQAKFVDIGSQLFQTFQALAP